MRAITIGLIVLFASVMQSNAGKTQSTAQVNNNVRDELSQLQSTIRTLKEEHHFQKSKSRSLKTRSSEYTQSEWLEISQTSIDTAYVYIDSASDGYNDWYDLSMSWRYIGYSWYCLFRATGDLSCISEMVYCLGEAAYCYGMHKKFD